MSIPLTGDKTMLVRLVEVIQGAPVLDTDTMPAPALSPVSGTDAIDVTISLASGGAATGSAEIVVSGKDVLDGIGFFLVDWGDGSTTTLKTHGAQAVHEAQFFHDYTSGGTYDIAVGMYDREGRLSSDTSPAQAVITTTANFNVDQLRINKWEGHSSNKKIGPPFNGWISYDNTSSILSFRDWDVNRRKSYGYSIEGRKLDAAGKPTDGFTPIPSVVTTVDPWG